MGLLGFGEFGAGQGMGMQGGMMMGGNMGIGMGGLPMKGFGSVGVTGEEDSYEVLWAAGLGGGEGEWIGVQGGCHFSNSGVSEGSSVKALLHSLGRVQ